MKKILLPLVFSVSGLAVAHVPAAEQRGVTVFATGGYLFGSNAHNDIQGPTARLGVQGVISTIHDASVESTSGLHHVFAGLNVGSSWLSQKSTSGDLTTTTTLNPTTVGIELGLDHFFTEAFYGQVSVGYNLGVFNSGTHKDSYNIEVGGVNSVTRDITNYNEVAVNVRGIYNLNSRVGIGLEPSFRAARYDVSNGTSANGLNGFGIAAVVAARF
jgi:hypothetical protein